VPARAALRGYLQAARHALAGLETLVGIQAVGRIASLQRRHRSGEIGQFVRRVEVMDGHGDVQVRERDELQFGYTPATSTTRCC